MPHFSGQHVHALTNLPCDYEGDYVEQPDGSYRFQASVVAADGGSRMIGGSALPEPPAVVGLAAVLQALHTAIDAQGPADAKRSPGP